MLFGRKQDALFKITQGCIRSGFVGVRAFHALLVLGYSGVGRSSLWSERLGTASIALDMAPFVHSCDIGGIVITRWIDGTTIRSGRIRLRVLRHLFCALGHHPE